MNTASRRSVLLQAATGAGATAVLSACAMPGQALAPAQLAPANLTYTTWWLPPGAPGIATERALQAYQQKRTTVQVRVEGLTGTAAQQMEKVQTMAAGG